MKHYEPVSGHVAARVPRALIHETAASVLSRLGTGHFDDVALVLVAARDGTLAGVVPMARLFAAGDARLEEIMVRDHPRVTPETDQEHAATLALQHGVDTLPVVDARLRALGVMPAQALMHVLRREHVEDLHVLAGIQRETSKARHAIEDPPLRRVRHRLPWLLVGLVGSAVAAIAMTGFESTFRAHIAVAFFVPGIVYLADAIGTQSEAVAVRGLSLTRRGLRHLLAGELRTGTTIGAVLALVALPPIWIVHGPQLAGAVATAILAAGTVAAALGLLLPWWIARRGHDPALGSGPLATVLQDIFSLLVYLGAVRAFGL